MVVRVGVVKGTRLLLRLEVDMGSILESMEIRCMKGMCGSIPQYISKVPIGQYIIHDYIRICTVALTTP